jgi:aldehyde:ferredoxin oxidoreductase
MCLSFPQTRAGKNLYAVRLPRLVLRIDLSSGAAEHVPLADAVLRQFIGGSGLGVKLLLDEGAALLDPLAPAAPLVFAFSPLVGSPLTTSAKFAVVSKSPLTERINDSLASSGFAIGKGCAVMP